MIRRFNFKKRMLDDIKSTSYEIIYVYLKFILYDSFNLYFLDDIILKMKEFVIQWRKFELKMSYINEFMNLLIYQDFSDFILIF